MKRYGLYIVAGQISEIDLGSDTSTCAVAICPITTYTLFDGNKIIDEISEPSIEQNDEIVQAILKKHRISDTEVDIVGGNN